MPSWEDGSERYLAEYRGETVYDMGAGASPLPLEGDEMITGADTTERERRLINILKSTWSLMAYYHDAANCESPECCMHCMVKARFDKEMEGRD